MSDNFLTRRGALFLAKETAWGEGADPGDFVYLPHEEVQIDDLGVGHRESPEIAQTDVEDPGQPVRQPASVGGKMALHPYRGTYPDPLNWAPAAGPDPHPPGLLLEAIMGGFVLSGTSALAAGSTTREINVVSSATFGPAQFVFVKAADGRPMAGVIQEVQEAPDKLILQWPLPAAPADDGLAVGAETYFKTEIADSYTVKHRGHAPHDLRTWVGAKIASAKITAGPADFATLEYAFRAAKANPLQEGEAGGAPDPQLYPWPEVSQVLDGGLFLVKPTGNPAPNEWELVPLTGGLDLDFGVESTDVKGIHWTDPNGINDIPPLRRKVRATLKPSWSDNYLIAQFREAALATPQATGGHFGLIGWWGVEGGSFAVAIRAGFQSKPPSPADEGGVQVLDAEVGSTAYTGDVATGDGPRDLALNASLICGFLACDEA